MKIKRRQFINLSAATAAGVATSIGSLVNATPKKTVGAMYDLQRMNGDVTPITVEERAARIKKAQTLMHDQNIEAMLLDAGTAMQYFTGISWWQSERPLVVTIPANGEPKYVCPAFEESRFRELISIGKDVYVWQEDESPYKQVAVALNDAGIHAGDIGIEERLRFFILDGVRQEAANLNYVSANPITIPCRMIKSDAEIALMQHASDITVSAIKFGIAQLHEGMTQNELSNIISDEQQKLGGGSAFALVLFGESSAFPHGSIKPQALKKGDIVLMDCGCTVEGYNSDITRTVVFGEPTHRQIQVWNLEQQAQAAAFSTAKIGAHCEEVDAAARKVITDAGFGPGYKLPGLPHRTGHGIGMDGHEWGNIVKGNQQLLQAGMCFSIEPTISIPGEFGVRLEDCVYMTSEGPKWFSPTSKSVTEPFG